MQPPLPTCYEQRNTIVKNPVKLQQKLTELVKRAPTLKLEPLTTAPWSELELKEAAWVVQDYVNARKDVIESDDPLREWLDEVKFYFADLKAKQ